MTADTIFLMSISQWGYVGSLLFWGGFWAFKHPAHALILSILMIGLMAILGSFPDISNVYYGGSA